jgi:DNA modification methylase
LVLDPFLGSGTTAAVARKLGRNWIGIEKKEKYITIAKKRLEKLKNNLF